MVVERHESKAVFSKCLSDLKDSSGAGKNRWERPACEHFTVIIAAALERKGGRGELYFSAADLLLGQLEEGDASFFRACAAQMNAGRAPRNEASGVWMEWEVSRVPFYNSSASVRRPFSKLRGKLGGKLVAK